MSDLTRYRNSLGHLMHAQELIRNVSERDLPFDLRSELRLLQGRLLTLQVNLVTRITRMDPKNSLPTADSRSTR